MLIPSNLSILLAISPVRTFCICIRTNNLPLFLGEPGSASISLSKATKLKEVVFRPGPRVVGWVIAALRTITPNHRDFRQITIRIPYYLTLPKVLASIRRAIGEENYRLWLDLDRFLVQFSESRSIRPKVVCTTARGTRGSIGCLLPEASKRGIIDLVECASAQLW